MNSEENSEATSNMYTVRDLAELRLSGYPDTERAWLDRAKNGGWRFIEIKGRGRGGIKRVYAPPPEIMALIEAQERGEPPPLAPARHPVPQRVAAPDPGKAVEAPLLNMDNLRMALALSKESALASGLDLSPDAKIELALDFYNSLFSQRLVKRDFLIGMLQLVNKSIESNPPDK